jgi:hypothetical protein
VTTNLDTLLTALYVLIDDHVIPSAQRRPGHPKRLSDAELVCLAVAQVLLGARSEHHWLRMCYGRLGHLFPYLPKQPGYHKRLKAAAPLICQTMTYLATQCPSWAGDLRLLDATPIPCGASRQTVKRSELAGWANYGYCAAHSRWYWGLKLYLLATPEGMPVAWCLADPKIGEREVAAELLAHARQSGALRQAMIVLADKGLAGRQMERYAADPDRCAARPPGPQRRTAPLWQPGRDAPMDRSHLRHPQRPAGPGTPRRPHPSRGLHPHRPAPAGPGRLHLEQLAHQPTRQAHPDQLRPLTPVRNH